MSAGRSDKLKRKVTKEERVAIVRRQRVIIGGLLLIVILYLCGILYYLNHFLPKTKVNGTEVGTMGFQEAAECLQNMTDTYTLSIKGPVSTEEFSNQDIALTLVDAAELKSAMRRQPAVLWPFEGGKEKELVVPLKMEYDSSALDAWMNQLQMFDEEAMEEPEDAYVTVSEDGTYAIVSEKEGTKLDVPKAKNLIREAISAGLREVDLTESRILPLVRNDDEALVNRAKQWNKYISGAGLTYNLGTAQEVLDKKTIASLLTDDGETVTLSRMKVEDLMAEWHEKYDTYGTSFDFKNYYGKTVTIAPYGDYGWYLDQDGTADDIMEKLEKHELGTYPVKYFYEPPYKENNGLGGNYVEVNIDEQHLWVYKDGKVIVDTDVVTGLPVHGSITYHGCYSIKRKDRDVTLGSLDVQGYENPVNYFVLFNGGEGIHDAPWREYFGGRIWIENGSHGCVNVPSWVMGDIFDNVEIGEAVVIYGKDYDEGVNERGHNEVNTDYYYDVYYGGA
ncbi:MAG: peptidoglycan binding domain-containing protein [Lachnospiraceae bacterium]|nr:peptidoglycan binding domain-containing protein [Lachnospiraceae bacterium]